MLREMLAEGQPPVFLGHESGRPVAMQSFLRPGFTPPLVNHDRNVYLFEGMVDPTSQARGAGNGSSPARDAVGPNGGLQHLHAALRESELQRCPVLAQTRV